MPFDMKYSLLIMLGLFATMVSAQTSDRVRQIRAMYARTQEVLTEQSQNEAINWSVKTTLRHNEPGVGVVRYEQEYYPLHLLDAYDFVRSKRYVTVFPPATYEILYDEGQPVFYFERSSFDEEVREYRIYWDAEGNVCEFVAQRVEDGRKVNLDYDGIEMYSHVGIAYRYAMQEYKRGSEGYDTDANGVGMQAPVAVRSREGLFQCVNQIYQRYFSPGLLVEPDEQDIEGLGKMYDCVTSSFNETYCMCSSKSIATDDLFHDYDIWINAQELTAHGLSGIQIRQYTDDKALVAVQIWNCDELTTVLLSMVFDAEKSTWLVADFIHPSDNSSYMARMNRFLGE